MEASLPSLAAACRWHAVVGCLYIALVAVTVCRVIPVHLIYTSGGCLCVAYELGPHRFVHGWHTYLSHSPECSACTEASLPVPGCHWHAVVRSHGFVSGRRQRIPYELGPHNSVHLIYI